MHTKTDIQRGLNRLREYSIANGTGTGYEELFAPLLLLVEDYFAEDKALEKKINYTLHQLVLDIQNRRTVYERHELLPAPPDESAAPLGYRDARVLFGGGGAFEDIMHCGADAFLAAFLADESGSEDGAAEQVASNAYLDKWQAQMAAAREAELAALQAVADFCESGSYAGGLAMLFEDLGQIIDSIGKEELAEEIYIKRGYKEIAEVFSLGVYMPTMARRE